MSGLRYPHPSDSVGGGSSAGERVLRVPLWGQTFSFRSESTEMTPKRTFVTPRRSVCDALCAFTA